MKKLIFLVVMFLLIPKVSAAIEVRKNYLPGIYYNYVLEGTSHWGRMPRITINDSVVFCIEPGQRINDTTYYQDKEISLDEEILKEIQQIGYYGYYFNEGDLNYLLATQKLIWELRGVRDVYFTEGPYGTGERVDIDLQLENIQELRDRINLVPSFANHSISVIEGQEIVLTDDSFVLDEYRCKNKNILLDENVLSFIYESNIGEIKLEKIPLKETIIYSSSSSQDLIYPGTEEITRDFTLNLELIETKVKLIYKNPEKPSFRDVLSNATYKLFDSEEKLLKTLEIDGEDLIVSGLACGNYKLIQINPETGYKPDKTVYEFEINEENYDFEIELQKEIIKNEIPFEIPKTSGDSPIEYSFILLLLLLKKR